MALYSIMRERINSYASKLPSERLKKMFLDCFFSTLDTTTELLDDGTSFVMTGDIPAMWLRDSSVQVTGYLPFVNIDEDVKKLIKGLLKRQFRYIQIDPYANAFNKTESFAGHQDDVTDSNNGYIWERKYEIDSLCYPLWLAKKYFLVAKDESVFDCDFIKAVELILNTFETEQYHFEKSQYFHSRPEFAELYPTLSNNGRGNPVAYTGMTWSGYRPSDDVCDYNYLIPSNMFAVTVLDFLIEVFTDIKKDETLRARCEKLNNQIKDGIKKFGTVEHETFGTIYAYETDGLGNYNLMDDANVPSLLSLPYLGYCEVDDAVYQNTRRFVLSESNPYFYSGRLAKGVGSPHTEKGYIWHIGLIVQLLTANNKQEIDSCFDMILKTDGGCGLMHESFNPNDPTKFSREWFAWANTMFALAVTKIFD